MYDRVPLQEKTTADSLQALGSYICYMGASFIKPNMDRMIKDNVNLADKCRLLQSITQAFNERFVELSAAHKYEEEFENWYTTAFTDILGTQQRATKDDGRVLGETARTCQPEVSEQILGKLKSASTQTVAAFVISLTKEDPDLEAPRQSTIVQDALDLLGENFEYSEPVRTHGAPVEGLNQHELADITDLTKKHGQLTINEVLKSMSEGLVKRGVHYIGENILPFIHSIMKHEIPSLIVEDDPDLFDPIASYIELVLCDYVRKLIGDEPKKPKDWSLPDRGCKTCKACTEVRAFMADGKQRVFKEQYNGDVRKHLDGWFDNWGSENEYKITIDKSARRFFWICTKTHGKYKSSLSEWKKNRLEAQNKLKSTGGPKSELLRIYLAEHFDAIMSCRTERLPDLDPATPSGDAPLGDVNASILNTSN